MTDRDILQDIALRMTWNSSRSLEVVKDNAVIYLKYDFLLVFTMTLSGIVSRIGL